MTEQEYTEWKANGKVCLGTTLNVQKTFGAVQQIPVTKADKQKAVVSGMFKALHK